MPWMSGRLDPAASVVVTWASLVLTRPSMRRKSASRSRGQLAAAGVGDRGRRNTAQHRRLGCRQLDLGAAGHELSKELVQPVENSGALVGQIITGQIITGSDSRRGTTVWFGVTCRIDG
jgi:hypothetical protein